jgi:hypothetical protein
MGCKWISPKLLKSRVHAGRRNGNDDTRVNQIGGSIQKSNQQGNRRGNTNRESQHLGFLAAGHVEPNAQRKSDQKADRGTSRTIQRPTDEGADQQERESERRCGERVNNCAE